jgi:hypothetical protein
MTFIEGIYKATIQIGDTQSPVLFVLMAGRFEGFDVDDRRYRGEYRQDEVTQDVVMTAEVSFPIPTRPGEPIERRSRSLTVRIPRPPDKPGVLVAADLHLDEGHGCVVIERLTDTMP